MGNDKSANTDQTSSEEIETSTASDEPRRNFLTEICAVVIGGFVGLFPFVTGCLVFFDPLRKREKRKGGADEEGFLRVASLDALLVDKPRRFVVIDDRVDAWNLFPQESVGAVYLLRTEDDKVQALNVTCPHAGCSVDFDRDRGVYQCPCHNSSFEPGGAIHNDDSPSPRGLDTLDVKVVATDNDTEVWVKYQNFIGGKDEKIEIE